MNNYNFTDFTRKEREEKKLTFLMHWSDVCDYIEEMEKKGHHLNERNERKTSWNAENLKNSLIKGRNGCEGCAKRIKETIIPIVKKQNHWGSVYDINNDVVGPFVDPGALSMGIPECAVYPVVTKTNVIGDDGIDIIVNAIVSSGVDADVIRNRGILAMTLALVAERMEIATRIVMGYTTAGGWGNGRNWIDFAITLKEYARPLDIPVLSFYLISPASTRRLGFSLFDIIDANSHDNNHGMPANTRYKTDRKRQIIVDHGYLRCEMLSPEAAIEEAITLLKNHGIIAGKA